MLKIKPIQTKDEQALACARCGVDFAPDDMAYGAYEGDSFLGVCQFSLDGRQGYIRNLREAEGIDDFEAMFIMGRAAMNFIDLCGVHCCVCADDAATERVTTAIGFKRNGEGVLFADMTGMFDGHCHAEATENSGE